MGFRKAACTNLWVPPSFSETAFVLFLGFFFFFMSIFMGTVYHGMGQRDFGENRLNFFTA